jgi:hypothetical protein
MNDKNDNLLLYVFAAFLVICALSLVISFFTFKKATNTQQVNTNPIMTMENNAQVQAQNEQNTIIQPVPTEPPVNTQVTTEVSPPANNVNPETVQKIEEKVMTARGYIQNQEFAKAEAIFTEIANENKGTVWEEQANKAIDDLKKIAESGFDTRENVVLGNLRQIQTCLATYMADNGKFPEINNTDNTRAFVETNCGYSDKNFFRQDLKNIVFENTTFDYRLIFELNSGKKYSMAQSGIQEQE